MPVSDEKNCLLHAEKRRRGGPAHDIDRVARGAAIAAVMQASLPVFEYSARQVKQAVVGRGGAEKGRVAEMVKYLLGLEKRPQEDAADALAIALCHAHMRVSLARMGGATAVRNGRIR